jgi:hypothetical protein
LRGDEGKKIPVYAKNPSHIVQLIGSKCIEKAIPFIIGFVVTWNYL